MNLANALKSAQMIGWKNTLLAVLYARKRDALEKRYPAPSQSHDWRGPGLLRQYEPAPQGGRFRFENAELEITFLAAGLARVTWTPGVLPIPYAIAKADWPPVEIRYSESGGGHEFAGSELRLNVRLDGRLTWRDAAGKSLRTDHPPLRAGEAWRARSALRAEEKTFGLGERTVGLNLRRKQTQSGAGVYKLWNSERGGIYFPGDDPLYKCVPVLAGLHGEGAYLVFYENTFPGEALLKDEMTVTFQGGALRYYFTPGPLPRALERYTELTGRAPLPPRWALGFHHSKVAYRTQAELRALVADLRQHDLPFSAIHMDLDYMHGFRTFTIDERRFPDIAGFAKELEDEGAKLVVIIDTAVKHDHKYAVFREGAAAEAFCKLPDGSLAEQPVWPGVAAFPDFTHPAVREWWGRYYPAFLEKGVAGFWHDMNEPATFLAWGDPTLPLPTRHHLEGREGDHREAHNVYGMQMNRAGFEALRKLRPDRRPWLLSRSGWAGVQRYAWVWTGDPASTWANLRATLGTVLGCGLSGLPYTGPDIGGFNGVPSNELFIRWFQLAAFLPFFRVHSAFTTARHLPYTLTESELDIVQNFLRLRYHLLPYLYSLAWECAQTGAPLVRPLFWSGGGPEWGDMDDEFLLGDALLVAPILHEGARSRDVFLPPGTWYALLDAAPASGRIHVELPLETMPLYVRAGSVLPVEEDGRLSLRVYMPPDGEARESSLYCDAGDGYGPALVSRFRVSRRGASVEMLWTREGPFPWPYRALKLKLYGAVPRRVEVDGQELAGLLDHPFERATFEL